MNWKLGGGGGGAIDLAMHLMDCDFKTALRWLDANFAGPVAVVEKQRSNAKAFQSPPRCDANLPRIKQYLCLRRRIAPHAVNALLKSGRLYADRRSNAVFPMLAKNAEIVGAALLGTGSAKWRGAAPGSRKSLGAFIVNSRKRKKMVVCESAVDAISVFLVHPWCVAVSTSGVSADPGVATKRTRQRIRSVLRLRLGRNRRTLSQKNDPPPSFRKKAAARTQRLERRPRRIIASRLPITRSLFNPPSLT